MMQFPSFFKSQIARRLVIYVLIFSSCITLALTTVQLYRDYKHEMSNIERRLHEIEVINVESVTNGLWLLNYTSLGLQLEGILRHPDIVHLKITDSDGSSVVAKGVVQSEDFITRRYPLTYSYRDRSLVLGELQVTATLKNVYQHLVETVIAILISQAIKTFLVSFFILIIVQQLVTRHLSALSRFAKTLRLDESVPDLVLERERGRADELQSLVNAINRAKNDLLVTHGLLQYSQDVLTRSQHVAKIGSWDLNLLDNSLYWSDETYNIFDLNREEFGANFQDVLDHVHPDDREHVVRAVQDAIEQHTSCAMEHRIALKDGSLKVVYEHAEISFDDEGNPVRMLGTVQDVSEQRFAQSGLERFRAALDSSADAIFLIDNETMRFIDFNQEASNSVGYSKQELLQLGPHDLEPEMSCEQLKALFKGVVDHPKEHSTFNTKHRCKDGRKFPVEVRIGVQLQRGEQPIIIAVARDVTLQKQEEQQLRDLLNHLSALYNATPDMLFLHAADGSLIDVNQIALDSYGYTREEMLKLSVEDFSADGYTNAQAGEYMMKALNGVPQDFEWLVRRKDGSTFDAEVRLRRLEDESSQGASIVAVVRDITLQKQHKIEITESRDHMARLVGEEQVVTQLLEFSLNEQDMHTYLNSILLALFESATWLKLQTKGVVFLKKPGEEVLELVTAHNIGLEQRTRCASIPFGSCLCGRAAEYKRVVHSATVDEAHSIHLEGMEPHGHYQVPLLSSQHEVLGVMALYLEHGHPHRIEEERFLQRIATVVSMGISRRLSEEVIEYQAYHDSLTSLPNRRLLADRLNLELSRTGRENIYGALLFVDLDNFKHLNDSLGHSVGDALLKQVAERMREVIREGDTVARLGGDEFVVLLISLSSNEREAANLAMQIGLKIQSDISRPYLLQEHEFHLTPSIGIAAFSGSDDSSDDLLKHADTAMYQAKAAGRNTLRFYEPIMQDMADNRLALEHGLRDALLRDELQLYLQPQVDSEAKIIGAEALLRWVHPERGFISPAEFIPVADDTGLIVQIGMWVLRGACESFAKASRAGQTAGVDSISINVCARQFYQHDFVESVQEVFESSGIDPGRVVLELTEQSLVRDINETVEKMKQLRALGVRFSIDDFGTGYSSLSYLKAIPLDELKIDQSFVRDIATDGDDAVIVETIIAIAKHLRFHLVAEGVEDEAQLAILKQSGCMVFQGYYFHRPMPSADFYQLLGERAG